MSGLARPELPQDARPRLSENLPLVRVVQSLEGKKRSGID
jgi:hypothetical protein